MGDLVLIVEDAVITGLAIADALADVGYRTIGPFVRSHDALVCLDIVIPDFAVLDVTLRYSSGIEVARKLRRLGVPFIVYSGWNRTNDLPEELRGVPWVEKPTPLGNVVTTLKALTKAMPEPDGRRT
jgi:DNA-binding response OmpR family regulator